MEQDEHRGSSALLLDDFSPRPKRTVREPRMRRSSCSAARQLKSGLAFQNDAGPLMLFVRLDGALAGHLEGANRERDGDLLPLEFVL